MVVYTHLELVDQQPDEIHEVNQFRRLEMDKKVGHQWRDKVRCIGPGSCYNSSKRVPGLRNVNQGSFEDWDVSLPRLART